MSGGRDSTVLLDALVKVRRLLKLTVEACHIDHGLRPSSAADAQFAIEFCAQREVPCRLEKLGEKPAGANMEAWARQQRYRIFREVLVERKIDWVLTAHTASDVAETLLIKLLANKELTTIERRDERRRCLRPLLDISRSQVVEYGEEHKVPFVEDPSNADTALVRNRVRHELLPFLERMFDPSAEWILAERAQAVAADCSALDLLAQREADALGGLPEGDPGWLRACSERLTTLPHALRWRVAERLAKPLVGYELGESSSVELVKLLTGEIESLQIKDGLRLFSDRFGLRILSGATPRPA